jgi:rubrerythrin
VERPLTANPVTGKTILEAIKHEIEGREFYLALAKRVKNPLVRRKILGLADDELEHRQTLSRLYWAQTGTEPGDLESYAVNVDIPDMEKMTLPELLMMAMETEKRASEDYSQMALQTEDQRSAAFLDYLAEFEQGHYETLAAELQKININPGWEDQGPAD